jgi:hypothetical protein
VDGGAGGDGRNGGRAAVKPENGLRRFGHGSSLRRFDELQGGGRLAQMDKTSSNSLADQRVKQYSRKTRYGNQTKTHVVYDTNAACGGVPPYSIIWVLGRHDNHSHFCILERRTDVGPRESRRRLCDKIYSHAKAAVEHDPACNTPPGFL